MNSVSRLVTRIVSTALQTYWKVFKPSTFGVKALILHPSDPGLCLMIRHSYTDQQRWGLPGGGYRPRREPAEDAVRRECREELGIVLAPVVTVLVETVTELEGKRDRLTIFRGTASTADLRPNREVAEARWTPLDCSGLPDGRLVSRWAEMAISAHRGT
ncbi:NUDIX hydrolase [Actinoplanes philippinensis]|uniref:8-oxo-dGTP pyrophosphatase MutT, NUDIX family n=1 Tax=Actinoplanes philippinensis TaxID=35752 RepID=A0A1I2ICJ9_9ACTN|nr:NUDIX domain-containing protein [Actinoplanes philippinensis]GIE78421.1 NUDIX hydrolase [Actinoplanes philippinensis]SFF39378.1 8-oxo-dGTP pyrophosphatase MutT, NUDIX family [Actinoplanes philippinensis]